MLPDYEYKGLIAEAWDVLRGDTSRWADRFFYLDVIKKSGQPVLDVGCGTGRLILDYLQQGIDIDGVDNSPDMIALCRQKAAALGLSPNVYHQYIETLALPRTYATILIPSSSIQLIIEPEMVACSLARLREHLQPGGVLAASVMTLWQPGEPLEAQFERTAVRPADGAQFVRVAKSRFDPAAGLEHTEDFYQKLVDGQIVAEETHQRSPATRSYTQAQARALFEENGFSEVILYSEFTFEPVKPGDTLFTVLGKKIG